MKEAACRAIRDNINQYAVTWGAKSLRIAIADKTGRWYGREAPLQEGAAFALAFPDESYAGLAQSYREKRDLMMALLRDVGFRVFEPHGACYIMTDAREIMASAGVESDVNFARWLIEEIGVATVPGSSFYRRSEERSTKIRFCYCKKQETLKLAAHLLRSLELRPD